MIYFMVLLTIEWILCQQNPCHFIKDLCSHCSQTILDDMYSKCYLLSFKLKKSSDLKQWFDNHNHQLISVFELDKRTFDKNGHFFIKLNNILNDDQIVYLENKLNQALFGMSSKTLKLNNKNSSEIEVSFASSLSEDPSNIAYSNGDALVDILLKNEKLIKSIERDLNLQIMSISTSKNQNNYSHIYIIPSMIGLLLISSVAILVGYFKYKKKMNSNDFEVLLNEPFYSQNVFMSHNIVKHKCSSKCLLEPNELQSSYNNTDNNENEQPFKLDSFKSFAIMNYLNEHMNDSNLFNEEWKKIHQLKTSDQFKMLTLNKDHNFNLRDFAEAYHLKCKPSCFADYILAKSPIMHECMDFWQIVWEKEVNTIITIGKNIIKGNKLFDNFWPSNGKSITFHYYELNIISENNYSDVYIIRNIFVQNLKTNETRTVTQLHYVSDDATVDHERNNDRHVFPNVLNFLTFWRNVRKCQRFATNSLSLINCCSISHKYSTMFVIYDYLFNVFMNEDRNAGSSSFQSNIYIEQIYEQMPFRLEEFDDYYYIINMLIHEVSRLLRTNNNSNINQDDINSTTCLHNNNYVKSTPTLICSRSIDD